MAGSSVSHSESFSDTYIPEYSESPILREIAQHARAMSDYVYKWGIDRFNENQGDIDSLMQKALTYASPQRIAVDMGMAEVSVQQAAERGRLSAERDLMSYGIDPSSGRFQLANLANRVMGAAAAAGAGNQQRMATEAAGNAMRNQALSASLQNAQFGLGVGGLANQYLQTASSLKYPPLGRYSTSVSDSSSQQSDSGGGGGSKGPKDEKQPSQQGGQGGGAAQPRPSSGPATPGKDAQIVKPPPKEPDKPEPPKEPPEDDNWKDRNQPDQGRPQPTDITDPDLENMQPPPLQDPDLQNMQPPPLTDPDLEGMQPVPAAEPPTGMDMEFDPWKDVPNAEQEADKPVPTSDYDPYEGNLRQTAFEDNQGQIDPLTGEPIDQVTDAEGTQDMAGSIYSMDGGDWSFEGAEPTAADWGDAGTDQAGTYDATYDTWTDPGTEVPVTDAEETPGGGDWSFEDYTDTEGQFEDTGDYSDTPSSTPDYGDYGDEGDYDYSDDYSQDDYEDVDDYSQDDYDTTDDYDYEDYADEDYAEDDAGDDSYEDYTDEDYEDDYEDYEEDDYSDDYSDDYEDDYDYSDSDSGDSGGDYARGGPVRKRRRRMATGFRPRPRRRRRPPGFAGGGRVPGQRPPMRPQMRPPGAMRMDPPPVPPQPPRPPRGMPMPARGGPRPAPMRTGMNAMPPGNMISANGMPPPTTGGMPRPQRMARGGQAGQQAEPTRGGFVSNELSPSGGSKVDDVEARLNAGEFVIPKDVAHWKGKEFFYKLIAQARKNRSGDGASQNSQNSQNSQVSQNRQKPQRPQRPRTGYGAPR